MACRKLVAQDVCFLFVSTVCELRPFWVVLSGFDVIWVIMVFCQNAGNAGNVGINSYTFMLYVWCPCIAASLLDSLSTSIWNVRTIVSSIMICAGFLCWFKVWLVEPLWTLDWVILVFNDVGAWCCLTFNNCVVAEGFTLFLDWVDVGLVPYA